MMSEITDNQDDGSRWDDLQKAKAAKQAALIQKAPTQVAACAKPVMAKRTKKTTANETNDLGGRATVVLAAVRPEVLIEEGVVEDDYDDDGDGDDDDWWAGPTGGGNQRKRFGI
jgi:hypothetical protein